MMIGKFKAQKHGGYTGELNALGLEIETMDFWPVKDKRADGADFIVIGYGEPPDVFDMTSRNIRPAWRSPIPTNSERHGKRLVRKANPIYRSSWTARHWRSRSTAR